MNTSIYL